MPPDSGIKVTDEAILCFNDMKLGKKKTRYIILQMFKEEGLIRLDDKCMKTDRDQQQDYEELISKLSSTDCRFIILDLNVERKNGSFNEQLFFICWNPDSSNIKLKTLYASSGLGVQKALKGMEGVITVQANDFDDFDYATLMEKGKNKG